MNKYGRLSCTQKTGHSPYKVPFLFYETFLVSQYLLFSITNDVALGYELVIYGSGFPKVHKGII